MSDSAPPKHTNRLIHEKSPYLQQHAHNPVDWHPWGDEAFAKAEAEDKMVLVSIGYATCHWCHVMERESFEDEKLAGYLNEHFVAIKVDREERPDVDKIYMDALHAMGQQGGWPLNVFTTPDRRPVIGGTYFPPQDMHGRPSFRRVLENLSAAWREQREDIHRNAGELTRHLQAQAALTSRPGVSWDRAPLEAATALYRGSYDRAHGGFNLQPQNKFPPSMGLMLLLRQRDPAGDGLNLEMVEHTLKKMVGGGIYDQLGGGLSRYSTDHRWLVPHFEKMLYDNALFAQALTEAHLVTGKPFYKAYAEDVLDYVLRDMTAPEGAFYSAEDADSEGEEGLFYVWTPAEVEKLLPAEQAEAAMAWWDITPQGNFEHGRSIPNAPQPLALVAQSLGVDGDTLAERLERAREALFAARCERIRPLRDEKILTSWNGLMISAMANAGAAFGEARWIAAAEKAGRFIREQLKDGEGRLLRRYRDGEARFKGYLTDHATFAVACLDLYQATFDPAWFDEAVGLMREVNRLFRNEEGPYFDTGIDAERLLARNMEGYDGVEPSGNTNAALAFLRLRAYGVGMDGGGREGGEDFAGDALRIFGGFHEQLSQLGTSFSAMLNALAFHLGPVREIAIVGDPAAADTRALLDVVRRRHLPNTVLALAPPEALSAPEAVDAAENLGALIPLLAGRAAANGRATAFVCQNMACKLPVNTPEALADQLG
ncbi:MAG: thioredoxin domain-containing protein [SAR324 cluster bacterium]|nr:thioredoxin domain-containing protein [SAR324 cluster bacterium]